jgi:hypothetical protein
METATKFEGTSPHKVVAREGTLLHAMRKSKLANPRVVSLCAKQVDHPNSEINQLVRSGLIRQEDYIGVDQKLQSIALNGLRYPDATFLYGAIEKKIATIDRTDGRPLVVYLDYMGALDAFWKYAADRTLKSVSDSLDNWLDRWPESWDSESCIGGIRERRDERARALIDQYPGSLPKVMDQLLPGDLIVVNIATEGRNFPENGTLLAKHRLVPALLAKRPDWKMRKRMSTGYFYNYTSGPLTYTSFCLQKPLTTQRKADKVTRMKNTTKPNPTTVTVSKDERKLAVYALLAAGLSEDVILALTGVSKGTLAAYKAHVTMGRSPV